MFPFFFFGADFFAALPVPFLAALACSSWPPWTCSSWRPWRLRGFGRLGRGRLGGLLRGLGRLGLGRRALLALRQVRQLLGGELAGLAGQRPLLDHHHIGPQHVVRGRLGEGHDVDRRQVPAAQVERLVDGRAQHEHLAVGEAEGREQRRQARRLRRAEGELLDHVQRAFARARVERALPRELLHLARNVRAIVARDRPEHDPAAAPMRRTGGALPRAAGALLLPGLLVAARDEAPGLGLGGALTLVVQVHLDRLVQHRLVHGAVERVGREGERRVALRAGRRVVRGLNHGGSGLPAWPR